MKRETPAMDFLMTYGWAILAAIISIFVLAYFGVFSTDSSQDICTNEKLSKMIDGEMQYHPFISQAELELGNFLSATSVRYTEEVESGFQLNETTQCQLSFEVCWQNLCNDAYSITIPFNYEEWKIWRGI